MVGRGASGYKFTDELKQFMKDNNMGWYAGGNNKQVFHVSDDGVCVGVHESAKQAAVAVGAYGADISKCCRGVIRSVKGWFFSYTNTPTNRPKKKGVSPLKKNVLLTDATGTVTKHPSVTDAARAVPCHKSNLIKASKTKKPIKGFFVDIID